ncbi:phosphomevalonate kinase [Coemansia sp. RSA 1933]|nr:phosphomevalonate kinase [Coemansia sp. RSA 1933]
MASATDANKSAVTLTSAPGKVLVVGGYLVLERNYSGLVVGTDASLYAAVQEQNIASSDVDSSAATKGVTILVVSPQFTSAWWKYVFNTESNKLEQTSSADGSKNGFVQVVLEVTLSLVSHYSADSLKYFSAQTLNEGQSAPKGLKVVLSADNDFYSQRGTLAKMGLDLSSESLRRLPRMCETGTRLQDVHKTGLGSSAAMVTSLVASIFVHFGVVTSPIQSLDRCTDAESKRGLLLIHNVAQFAHCLAQGKVGSGFDVSAAVFGSHVYCRFAPAVIKDVMGENQTVADIAKAVSPDNPGWNSVVGSVDIPPRFLLRLADVDTGSNTPSMVKKVLHWQETHPEEAKLLWNALDAANNQIRAIWTSLGVTYIKDAAEYNQTFDWCSMHKSSEWKSAPELSKSPTLGLLCDLVEEIRRVRSFQRELGRNAGVPIEPPEQTKLLDACMEVPGVCMAAVPGAGGYDAIYCVTLGRGPSKDVENLWSRWKSMSVGPLLANQTSSGVRVLDADAFPEILAILNASS